jgi:deoxyribodipyrimidine photolyase-related protein
MKTLRFILGDQLSRSVSALRDVDPSGDVVLMVEAYDEMTYVRHHKQKIVLILSAMRHFAETLSSEGIHVDYIRLKDEGNSGSLTGELTRALSRHTVDRIVVTEPGEWRVWHLMQEWHDTFRIPVEIREDTRFLCSRTEFTQWAQGRKQYRMEYFYRYMRRKTGWLMNGNEPEGGRWNYDAENRKALSRNVTIPTRLCFKPDMTTRDVMVLVEQYFPDHFGDLESFTWGVTPAEAIRAARHFIRNRLARFGDYQDAMKSGEDFLFHSVLSPYINIGLLDAGEVCQHVLEAYKNGMAPLPAVEGFIRQILGWREYVRGIYWLHMPEYAHTNVLSADRPLPQVYWTGKTQMQCMRETIESTRRNAYAHHIQRLMITGNFALLTGVEPAQVEEWYLVVYADAFEWVELPNTHGMVLYADGGMLGSKPYAASGAYINRMSDYCTVCSYDPKIKRGSHACPFNYLYWYFFIVNEKRLATNPRTAMPLRTLARMSGKRRQTIITQARAFLEDLDGGTG